MLCWWPHDFGSISWWSEKNVGGMWGICLLILCSSQPSQNSANTVWFNCELALQCILCFLHLTMLDWVVHLGNYLTMNLSESHCQQSVVVTETQRRLWLWENGNWMRQSKTKQEFWSLHYHKSSPITTNQKSKGTWCVLESPDLPRVS